MIIYFWNLNKFIDFLILTYFFEKEEKEMIKIEISEEKFDVLIEAALKYALENKTSNLMPLIADICRQMSTSGLLVEWIAGEPAAFIPCN